ncbi:DNA repair protein XRCC3-like isoform X1 [Oratosquilla oratoria]|uniref:DNA repair protein XRCC3-like isoform X1 n=1 Tax=Oratosquilla oratoria TaxID=337810 RepID=UPI003F75CDDE
MGMASAGCIGKEATFIERLDIHPRIIESAKRNGYTSAWSIINSSPEDIEQRSGLTAAETTHLISCVVNATIKKPCTAWQMFQCPDVVPGPYPCISFGCQSLNKILQGGLPIRSVTEIYGPSGSGKTQVALQLAIQVQLPVNAGGLGKGTAYICTESQFPARRLRQMADHCRVHHPFAQCSPNSSSRSLDKWTNNIHVQHIANMEDLLNCIQKQLPMLMQHREVGLVVIDSVAAVFRVEDAQSQSRSQSLTALGYALHQLAMTKNLAVLALNQVTSARGHDVLHGSFDDFVPALGLAWSNLITTRLALSRKYPQSQQCVIPVRNLEVHFSPWLPRASANFIITEEGLKDMMNPN